MVKLQWTGVGVGVLTRGLQDKRKRAGSARKTSRLIQPHSGVKLSCITFLPVVHSDAAGELEFVSGRQCQLDIGKKKCGRTGRRARALTGICVAHLILPTLSDDAKAL